MLGVCTSKTLINQPLARTLFNPIIRPSLIIENDMDVLESSKTWTDVLGEEKQKPYFQNILSQIEKDKKQGKTVYPPQQDIFNALKLTPFNDVKVVIIGQDPYHGPNQAMGLCFSVREPVPPPPSLVNIYKELQNDLNLTPPSHGNLASWARQGVLLLNATLTVLAHQPQSHAGLGWQQFTDTIIQSLNQHDLPIVFLLWGAFAQKKAQLIDTTKHHILKAPHPSPLSAHRGFFGCGHFSKANALLTQDKRGAIDWQL